MCFGLFCILHSFAPHWQFMNMTTATVHGQRLNVVVFSVRCSLFSVRCSVFCVRCSVSVCGRACTYIYGNTCQHSRNTCTMYVRIPTPTHATSPHRHICSQSTSSVRLCVRVLLSRGRGKWAVGGCN